MYSLTDLKCIDKIGAHAFTKFIDNNGKLSIENLDKITMKYPFIESISICKNNLISISALCKFQNLKFLDVSENNLKEFDLNVEFNVDENKGNQSLLRLNLSKNNIKSLNYLSKHIYLEILDLSYNNLTNIQDLKYLTILQ